MEEKFSKIWNGEEWIRQKIRNMYRATTGSLQNLFNKLENERLHNRAKIKGFLWTPKLIKKITSN